MDAPTSVDLARAIDRTGLLRQLVNVAHQVTPATSKYAQATVIQGLRERAPKDAIDWERVKRDVNPALVLEAARRLYQVDPSDYGIASSEGGAPRLIRLGKQYNAADFFTKHLGRPWVEARRVLLDCYHASLSEAGPEPNAILWRQFSQWRERQLRASAAVKEGLSNGFRERALQAREAYRLDKQEAQVYPPRPRAIRVARARAERFVGEQRIAQERVIAYEALRRPPLQAHYRQFLGEIAQQGDVAALAELRRMAAFVAEDKAGVTGDRSRAVFALPNYKVDARGGVTYEVAEEQIVRDGAQGVAVLRATPAAYNAALRIAAARYGRDITLRGDAAFMRGMTEAARSSGLELRIHDGSYPQGVPVVFTARAHGKQL